MSEKSEIRPLTRQEQLEWYIPFLKEQIAMYQKELLLAEKELLLIKSEQQKEQTVGNSL